ncbi:MAG: hypothetical protein ACRDYU_13095 [Actinomycetes bacterium]
MAAAPPSTRAAGLAAIVYVVLVVAGVGLLGTPEGEASDATWVAHFADKGSRWQTLAAGLLLVVAGLAFLLATAGLVSRLAPGTLATLLAAAGTTHGVLVVLAGMAGGSIAIITDLAGMPLPRDPDLLRASDAMMFATLLIPGMLAAGLVAWCCGRGGWLPRPLALAGLVVAVLSVAGLALFPVFLWLLWLVAVAVVLLRSRR